MTEVLERLIENRRRHLLLKRANEEYAKARAEEPEAWAAFCTEAEEWDQIGGDGLDEE
ncbi:MAG: hypothetical protein JXQ29_12625 [Planctomycetes bacterium]|nr:hypothetical protein [Planctomycetota bacterium]